MLDVEATENAFAHSVAAVTTVRDVIEVSGADAAVYLQGQLSQDIAGLAVGASADTLVLQPQGKVDAWMRVSRLAEDSFWLDVDPGAGAAVVERLNRFKLRVAAEIDLRAAVPTVAVRGPGAAVGADGLGFVVPEGAAVLTWTAGALRSGMPGFDVVGEAVEVPADLATGPVEALEALRIRLGLPAMGRELDGSTIPAAAGIVDFSVDFTKGCYVGQELVARVDSRGSNTPTRLRGLRFAEPVPLAPEAELTIDGEVVGRVTSYAVSGLRGPVGLGYLRRSVEVPATVTVSGAEGRPVAVEVVELPIG